MDEADRANEMAQSNFETQSDFEVQNSFEAIEQAVRELNYELRSNIND